MAWKVSTSPRRKARSRGLGVVYEGHAASFQTVHTSVGVVRKRRRVIVVRLPRVVCPCGEVCDVERAVAVCADRWRLGDVKSLRLPLGLCLLESPRRFCGTSQAFLQDLQTPRRSAALDTGPGVMQALSPKWGGTLPAVFDTVLRGSVTRRTLWSWTLSRAGLEKPAAATNGRPHRQTRETASHRLAEG